MKKIITVAVVFILLLTSLSGKIVLADGVSSPQGNVLCGRIEQGELLYPQGIFVNKDNNIFVVDQGNCRVQEFNKKGKFIRMFGGKDYLYRPSDVAVLPDGNIIVLDSYNQATTGSGIAVFSKDGKFIKKINSFGKDGSYAFNAPSGVSLDKDGNIYITDTVNNRILIFDDNLNFLEQFGNDYLSSPTGIAVGNKNIYVGDFGNRRIDIFSKDTYKLVNTITQFTVKRNVGFWYPYYKTFTFKPSPLSLSVDDNNLYFVDAKEDVIVSFGKNGKEKQTIERFGTAKGQFVKPYGISVFNNIIYTTDQKLGRVLAFDANGNYKFGIYSTIYEPYSVDQPMGISEDKDGNIYICDEATGRILKVDKNFSLEDMDFSNSDIPFKDVHQNGEVGQVPFVFYPQEIQMDKNGNIYVLDYGSIFGEIDEGGFTIGTFSRILKFSQDLKYKRTIADVRKFPFLTDFIIDKGYIFATALSGIFKFDLSGEMIAQNASLGMPEEITKGNDGYLYIADSSHSSIDVIDTNLKLVKRIELFGHSKGGLAYSKGVAIAQNGNIYVADTGNSQIVVFDKNGDYKFSFGNLGNKENKLIHPTRIFIKGKSVFVSDPYASTVKVFDLSGNFKQYIASNKFFSGAFIYPSKVAVNSSGMMAVLDNYMGRIYLYKNGSYLESFNVFPDYSKRFSNFIKENELIIGDIALGEDNSVYLLNGNDSTITRFYNNGLSADVDSSLTGFYPSAITISKNGILYIASSEGKVIYGKWSKGSFVKKGEIDLSKVRTSIERSVYPAAIFVKRDILYIADTSNFAVEAFNMKTKHLITIPIKYPESEMSSTPEGVTADNNGNIYVCNSALSRIEVYDNDGKFLYEFGKKGGPLGDASVLNSFPGAVKGYVGYFLYPSGIALSNDHLYIADTLNRRIQSFDVSNLPSDAGVPCVAGSVSKQGVTLNWKTISKSNVKGYAVFKKEDNSFKEIARLDALKDSYLDRVVKNGETYNYFVRTILNNEKLSFPTNAVSVNVEGVVRDTTPPDIKIISPNNNSIANADFTIVKGTVTDESGLRKLTINKNNVSVSSDGSFSTTVNLTKDSNTITIVATDKAGNEATKTITVIYRPEIIITLQPNNPNMTVNGVNQEIDPGRGTKPVIILKWSRTVVPIRAIVEALGGTIKWDGKERKVTINLKGTVIELWINKPQARVNGEKKWIDSNNHDVRPIIVNSRTMLPLRFVTENLGCTVDWDPDTKTITITYSE